MFSQAWSIYKDSFRTVSAHFTDFIKIWFLTFAITSVIVNFIAGSVGDSLYSALIEGDPNAVLSTGGWLSFICSIFVLFVFSGLCVSTHRYLILGEREVSWVPFNFKWGITFGYFWRILVIALIAGLIVFFFAWILGSFIGIDLRNGGISRFGLFMFWLMIVAASFISSLLTFRMFMALVAQAVDQPVGIFETFKLTKGESGLFFAIVVFNTLFVAAFTLTMQFLAYMAYILPDNGFGMFIALLIYMVFLAIVLYAYAVFITVFSKVYQQYYLKK